MNEIKIIISDNNFKAKVSHLQNDMFLYHRQNEEEFKGSNSLNYYLAILYNNKLYDINIKSIYQFKDSYNFDEAVKITKELLNKNNISGSINDYIKTLIQSINENKWIYKWLFDIIKDYDEKHKTDYLYKALKQRDEIFKKNEEEKQKRIKEYEEKQAKQKEEEEKQKLEEEKENYCNGFTNNMQPMKKQKVYNILNKKFRYDGVIRKRKENVLYYLKNGSKPEEKQINNKTIYILIKGNTYLDITKTEYEYALYLLNYGLNNAI
jgi:septum formation inhibitor MinC